MRRFALLAAVTLVSAAGIPTAASAQPQTAPAPAPATGKVYVLEMIQTGEVPADLTAKLAPLHTLAEVEAVLKQSRIPFAWRVTEAHAATMPPAVVAKIDSLPPHEVFVAPQKVGLLIAVVLETR